MKKLTAKELEAFKVGGPRGSSVAEEIGGYHDATAGLLGIVLLDKFDKDFGFVVLKQSKANAPWTAKR